MNFFDLRAEKDKFFQFMLKETIPQDHPQSGVWRKGKFLKNDTTILFKTYSL